MNIFAHLSVTAYYGMPSLRSAQYYVWLVLKALYTINRYSYLSEFFCMPANAWMSARYGGR